MPDLFPASRDWSLAHPQLRPRYEALAKDLKEEHGIALWVNEIYRSDARQGWLYGQGRTPEQLRARFVEPAWARPGPIVTNAWSAATSAHGFRLMPPFTSDVPPAPMPAACALDVVPIGDDGKPWTKDDDWTTFVKLTTDPGSLGWQHGLAHFHRPGIAVWDQPHLQMIEWSDLIHDLVWGAISH